MEARNRVITSDVSALEGAGWQEFVSSHPHASFFQLPAAYQLFMRTKGYEPEVLGIIDERTNRLHGIFLTVIQKENTIYKSLTRRSISWGGPLALEKEDSLDLLIEYDRRIRSRAIYTQIRNLSDQHHLKEAFGHSGYAYKPHLNSMVYTKGYSEEEVLSRMSKSRSRQIRKGLERARLQEAVTAEEFSEFHSILNRLYTTKVMKPLPHLSFFEAFRTLLVPTGQGKLLVVKCDDRIIGGILCAIMPGKAIYEWYIAGLDDEFKETHPSVLATWAAIRYAINEGLNHFDFLGAGSPESSYGVRDFKERFGGETVEFGRFEKIHQPVLMKIGTFGLHMKQWIR